MFFELIGTFAAGFAAAGLVLILNRVFAGRLPKWLMPVVAGVAMLATTISNEYGWYARAQNNLPDGIVVAQTIESQAFYRPWTYVKPYVSRFVAVDHASIRKNESVPDQRIVNLIFYGRWAPVQQVPVVFDCATARRADVGDGMQFGPEGQIINVDWIGLEDDNPVLKTACAGA
ncbi:hypothetical protein [Parasulfitobacter algicola]|uniref:Uncharacterized protein n=1 Tax=Parasulfitobacter algicola TaxID=2614809 RepID=A0ABX2IRI1_9RHOB|nr:hypothetical protein [Sulfitobacter algicola]NSX55499.1 hypothetical protein [Sulfitobacter algicola]